MKRIVFALISLLSTMMLIVQTPESFRYQAVARDNSGNVLANQEVSFQISILIGSVSGTEVYKETHTGKTTNAFGLVELEIGKGTPVTATFSSISWADNTYFVKIEMDPAGGNAYQIIGISQLLSVPYALHANTSETASDAVQLSGNQTIKGEKSFTGRIIVRNPTNANDAVNKAYLDALESRFIELENFVLDKDRNGYKVNQGDCNDLDSKINPGAQELCDELDNDCDGAHIFAVDFE